MADIIYVGILPCFVHLSVTLDAFSLRAIGYRASGYINTPLALYTLSLAIGA
jgi:hypothetical protein